jgi:predicted amidohydrolase YtcJ
VTMRVFLGLAGMAAAAVAQVVPDAIYHNGVVYTVDADFSIAEAIAVRDGRIAAIGTSDDLLESNTADTKLIDLQGRTVVPGLIDAHGHMLGLGQSLQNLDLVGTESFDAIVTLVSDRVANARAGDWILGRGWDQNDWPDTAMPSHKPLSACSPDNPVVLGRIGGHALLVNAAAMTIAGIDRDTPDPPGGKILRDANGEPTGVLLDTAQSLVGKHVPRESEAETREALALAEDACLRVGLTGVHDAGVSPDLVETYKTLIDDDAFDFRVYVMIRGGNADELRNVFADGRIIGYGGGRLTVRCIKVMSDGALGSRGAALREPYSDDPGNTGLLIVDEPAMTELTEAALRAKYQVATHAIGDLANHAALNAFEAAMKAVPDATDPRLRIEHAQVIALEDIPRFAELGVIPSMQATHATSDMPWAPKRLGPERTRGAYAWRQLMDTGARIANGSDFPVENNNPLWGIYAAVTRQDHDGRPQEAWQPEERMTRKEALRSFTIDAAYAAFEEDVKGSLEVGKYADFVVFDNDIVKISARELLETSVVMTILDGEIVYEE